MEEEGIGLLTSSFCVPRTALFRADIGLRAGKWMQAPI